MKIQLKCKSKTYICGNTKYFIHMDVSSTEIQQEKQNIYFSLDNGDFKSNLVFQTISRSLSPLASTSVVRGKVLQSGEREREGEAFGKTSSESNSFTEVLSRPRLSQREVV